MTATAALILIAVAAGIAVALQGQVMGAMNRTAGTPTSIFVTYGVGGLLATIYWLTRGAPVDALRRVPWPSWTAGALGLVIVGGIGYASPRLGLSRTLVLTVAAQLVAAMILERTFDVRRAAGLALTVAGVWLVVKE
jgi:transporter family-2 protein